MSKSSRTKMDFTYDKDVIPIVRGWAEENLFKVNTKGGGALRYRRSGGSMMCPVMLEIRQSGEQVHLETWLEVDILTEFTTLFMAPQESTIQSGKTMLWREKEIARLYVNPLLAKLKQPPLT